MSVKLIIVTHFTVFGRYLRRLRETGRNLSVRFFTLDGLLRVSGWATHLESGRSAWEYCASIKANKRVRDTIEEGIPMERRRRYSGQFKAEVVAKCQATGVSVATVALEQKTAGRLQGAGDYEQLSDAMFNRPCDTPSNLTGTGWTLLTSPSSGKWTVVPPVT